MSKEPRPLGVGDFLAFGAVGGCAFFCLAASLVSVLDLDASDAAAWVGALGTAFAFAVAAVAARAAWDGLLIERQRDRRLEDNEQRAQAAKVAVWAEDEGALKLEFGDMDPGTLLNDLLGVRSMTVYVRNASDLPVRNALVFARIIGHVGGRAFEGPFLHKVLKGGLGPGVTREVELQAPDHLRSLFSPQDSPPHRRHYYFARPCLQFTDAEGSMWHRDNGILNKGRLDPSLFED
ncbi:hypothetical protein [Nocardioides sp. AX2bis]|uniref:hypothetical protein n=1 Tax=Nocardioides sp. AX2bis TaxID=2653157 RepID=UPI0012F2E025|nr:hypothetical protein [Nocardioides sp. AX2bis]VXC44535.1 hypothetical protein NOCARDAX2BIS_590029 [Nocardioides sp. AX2bis]